MERTFSNEPSAVMCTTDEGKRQSGLFVSIDSRVITEACAVMVAAKAKDASVDAIGPQTKIRWLLVSGFWFFVISLFTKAVDEPRKKDEERKRGTRVVA